MKKFRIMLCTLAILIATIITPVNAADINDNDTMDLINRCFNGVTLIYDQFGNNCTEAFIAKYSDAYSNQQYQMIESAILNSNYDYITPMIDISTYAFVGVTNGFTWEQTFNNIISRVSISATVTYNENTGVYNDRTQARASFSLKGSNAYSCGIEQPNSSVEIVTNSSIDYVKYRPRTYIKYKSGEYRYCPKIEFKVMCYSGTQPGPQKY